MPNYQYNLSKCRVILSGILGSYMLEQDNPLILNPVDYMLFGALPQDWADWLNDLIIITSQTQKQLCLCGHPLREGLSSLGKPELHHALLSKRDVMGVNKQKRPFIIHHSCNIVMMHTSCHVQATRAGCLAFLELLYGDKVEQWYNAVDLKSKPRNIWLGM